MPAALVKRGLTLCRRGEGGREIAEYTSVIEQLPDAPAGPRATALANRGYEAFLRDTESALSCGFRQYAFRLRMTTMRIAQFVRRSP